MKKTTILAACLAAQFNCGQPDVMTVERKSPASQDAVPTGGSGGTQFECAKDTDCPESGTWCIRGKCRHDDLPNGSGGAKGDFALPEMEQSKLLQEEMVFSTPQVRDTPTGLMGAGGAGGNGGIGGSGGAGDVPEDNCFPNMCPRGTHEMTSTRVYVSLTCFEAGACGDPTVPPLSDIPLPWGGNSTCFVMACNPIFDDCPAGQQCVMPDEAVCIPERPLALGDVCIGDDCGKGLLCYSGRCMPLCHDNCDCALDESCIALDPAYHNGLWSICR